MKSIFWVLTLMIGLNSSAQNNIFLDASKKYPDGKTISYFTFNFLQSEAHARVYGKLLKSNDLIYDFSIYDKTNFRKILLKYSSNIDEEYIKNLTNVILEEENTCKEIRKNYEKFVEEKAADHTKESYKLAKKEWVDNYPKQNEQLHNCSRFIQDSQPKPLSK